MIFPALKNLPVGRTVIDRFGGYRHRERIGTGEFYDMQNMSADHYPLLSTRSPRGTLREAVSGRVQAMAELDGLCLLTEDGLYHEGHKLPLELSPREGRRLIQFGSYLIVMPDKKYINLHEPTEQGELEAFYSVGTATEVQYSLCNREGMVYEAPESATAPENPEDGQYWLDVSSYLFDGTAVLKQYSKALGLWTPIPSTCVRIQAPGIGKSFREGDWIFVDGEDVRPIHSLHGLCDAPREVTAAGQDFIVLRYPMGKAAVTVPDTESLRVERRMPETDFLFEHENRLWGCRYGRNRDGDFVNEIYASKLGDFRNWYCFRGISTDSYAASCGTDGPWTGAIHALGYPLFFKENCLHKVYGSSPESYQIQTLPCRGVQRGSEKSLAIVNGVLLYKAADGVVRYDGSLPESISDALGEEKYHSAVAGAMGDKYYISMCDSSGKYQLFCYHSRRGLWHREDELRLKALCATGGQLCYLAEGENIPGVLSGGEGTEKSFHWYAETGLLGAETGERSRLSRITARVRLALGSRLRFLVRYDEEENWECLASFTGKGTDSFSVPLRLRRCDHLRLRLEGEGEAQLYSLCLERRTGGYGRRV